MNGARTAIVTGAANGIGTAVTLTLLASGHDVLAVDVDVDGLNRLEGRAGRSGGLFTAVVDVTDEESVTGLPELIGDRSLDLLVNNAGIGMERPFHEITPAEWRAVLDVDVMGPYLVSQACWGILRRPGGAIVNVSSIHGSRPLPGQAAYAAAKGGLENLTRALALDAAPHGIRVNAVAPGFTRTRLWTNWMESEGLAAPKHEAEVRRIIPLGRPGEPQDVADAVAWLGGLDARYVTGVVLPVDGGLLARAFYRREDL